MRNSLKIVCYILIFVSIVGAAVSLLSLLASVNGNGDWQQSLYLVGACVAVFLCAGAIVVLIEIAERLDKGPIQVSKSEVNESQATAVSSGQ